MRAASGRSSRAARTSATSDPFASTTVSALLGFVAFVEIAPSSEVLWRPAADLLQESENGDDEPTAN
jgi:hypothetical protein